MGRRVDISEKLGFEEKPVIVIRGREIEVNDDAANVIRIMGLVGGEDPSPSLLGEMSKMLFTEKGNAALSSLSLNMKDLSIVIETAMSLITGDDEEGEFPNDITTSWKTGT